MCVARSVVELIHIFHFSFSMDFHLIFLFHGWHLRHRRTSLQSFADFMCVYKYGLLEFWKFESCALNRSLFIYFKILCIIVQGKIVPQELTVPLSQLVTCVWHSVYGKWLTVSSPYSHWVICLWIQPPTIPTVSTPADDAKILFQRKVHLQNYLQVRDTPPHTRDACVNVNNTESPLVMILSSSSESITL